MKKVYILHNQERLYFKKPGHWVPNTEALWHTENKDVAVNTRVEQCIKNPMLRITMIETTLDNIGLPIIKASTPKPIAEHFFTQKQLANTTARSDSDNNKPLIADTDNAHDLGIHQ